MKRPFGVYFVALWLFFCGTFVLNLFFRTFMSSLMAHKEISQIIKIVGLAFLIYVSIGVIQVKLYQRIISIIVFSFVLIYQISLLLVFFLSPAISIEIIKFILLKVLVVILSIVCIIYLLDPHFRKYAKRYVDWKDQDSMEKYIKKKMLKGIGK